MTPVIAPAFVDRVVAMTLHGYVVPWASSGPVVVDVGDGTNNVPIFSDIGKLTTQLTEYGIPYVAIKVVNDGPTFVAQMRAAGYTLIVDPHKHGDRLRYCEILWDA